MRYEEVLVLILLVGLALYWNNVIQKQRFEKGVRFCRKVIDLKRVYSKVNNLERENSTKQEKITGVYYQMSYDPQKPQKFFEQMEFGIINAMYEYDAIRNQEFNFTEEDWNYISQQLEELNQLNRDIRYETWRRGFRKV